MAKYEQREGDIVIYKEENVEGNRPQWRGKALIDGKERDVSLWIKGDSGTMLAGQIQDKFVPDFDKAKPSQSVQVAQHTDLEDEIPF